MSFSFKQKCLVVLVASGLTSQSFAAEPEHFSTDTVENGLASERYIITYKNTHYLAETNKSFGNKFDLTNQRKALQQQNINIVLELPQQRSIAVQLTQQKLAEMRNDPSVEMIEPDLKRKFLALYNDDVGDANTTQLTPYAVYQSQAKELSLQPGQKVCVIDSGIAGSDGETGGLNNDFDWDNITGSNDSGTGNWNADGGPHGTHVAGTIAAVDNDFGVIGMAPSVPLHIIKVFNDSGWGYSSNLAKAANDCADAGANIITMSLGGGGANSTEENAFNDFTNNGGLVLAAAGNDGNNVRSFPAGYDSVMMVGANDGDNNIASFSQFPSCNEDKTNCVEVTAGGVNTLSTYPSGAASSSEVTIDDVGIQSSTMENSGDVSGVTFFMGTAEAQDAEANGKICVIDRGTITFQAKVQNCEDSGGIGAIIINNESGLLSGTLGEENPTTIPAVGTALEDRDAILAAANASITINTTQFGLMSGTSMATPGVAGVAALVWSNHPTCTGSEIRNVLRLSAEDSGAEGHDDYFGNGIVKAKNASDLITANGCNQDNLQTGRLVLESESYVVSEGGNSLEVVINRINASEGEISVDISTIDGSAQTPDDYVALAQRITFANGETSKTLVIEISDDTDYEGDENFSVTLSNPSANTDLATPKTALITIQENDPMPPAGDFAFSDAEYSVGENSASLNITVNRIEGSYGIASVGFTAIADSASGDEDFENIAHSLTFDDGETSKQVEITIIDDMQFEGDETFSIELANPSERSSLGLSTAVVTINEDDPEPPAGEINWAQSTLTLGEADGSFNLTVERINGSYGECRVTATISHTSTSANDFVSASPTEIIFADGETSKTVSYSLNDDADDESDESFNLVLTTEPKCVEGNQKTLAVTITDDDETSGGGSFNWLALFSLLMLRLRRAKK